MTIICDLDPDTAGSLRAVLSEGTVVTSMDGLRQALEAGPEEDTVVLGPSVNLGAALRIAETGRVLRPSRGVILVRRRVDSALLADALRSGVRDVVDARDLAGLNAAVRRNQELATSLRESVQASRQVSGDTGKVITVFSAKGGCGKTTLATNLAVALADRGRREVCLVDLDLAFGDVGIALQLFPARTLADLVPLGDNLDFTGISGLLTPHSPGLTTLVAPTEPGSAQSIPASLIEKVLQILKRHFDFVVVDTPPAFDDQVLTAFDCSDLVALLATLDIPALKNLKLTLETMSLLNYPRQLWHVVLNRADSKVGLSIAEVEKTLRTRISVQIPSSRDVPAAINRGVPIVLDDPRHPVSLAITTFAERYVLGQQLLPGRGATAAETLAAGGALLRRRRSRA